MTKVAILEQFDQAARDFVFPMLDTGYVYPADVRLSTYRTPDHWLMIIEVLGVNFPRSSGLNSFQNCLHIYGNDLGGKFGFSNENFLYPVESLPEAPLFEDPYGRNIRQGAYALSLRGQKITLDLTPGTLRSKGISLLEHPLIDPVAVLRSLLPQHRSLLLASEEQLQARNDLHLPLLLRLDEWFHPNLAANDLPSECETFQMLADTIVTGNLELYRPTLKPNTHWQNWPEGGSL